MKKVQEKRRIIRTMSESQIRDLGMSLWVKRKLKWVSFWCAICIAWMCVVSYITDYNQVNTIIVVSAPVIIALWGVVKLSKEGNKLWDKVKDKEQPIDLG